LVYFVIAIGINAKEVKKFNAKNTHNVNGRKGNFVALNAGEACLSVLSSSIFFALYFLASFASKSK
jgi:hypothetical protein